MGWAMDRNKVEGFSKAWQPIANLQAWSVGLPVASQSQWRSQLHDPIT
jgi:hypothetical protein